MSKHAWLLRPTRLKARRLADTIDYAMCWGHSASRAELFAGYVSERVNQGQFAPNGDEPGLRSYLLGQTTRANWRLEQCRNAENYRAIVRNHYPLIALVAPETWQRIIDSDSEIARYWSCASTLRPYVEAERYQDFLPH